MAKRPHTPTRQAETPAVDVPEADPMMATIAPVAPPPPPSAPTTPCLLTVPCDFPFQITRARQLGTGRVERYCDLCGAVQGQAADSRGKATG